MTADSGDAAMGAPSPVEIELPEKLDFPACERLAEQLDAARGVSVRMDAAQVRHLGAMGLQLLISAQREWGTDRATLEVAPRSADFVAGLAALGVDETMFGEG